MAHTELREALGEAIARLPEREKLVVTLYYYEELTLREIGEVLGVTESRVSQLHTKAILRLKARLSFHAARTGLDAIRPGFPTARPGQVPAAAAAAKPRSLTFVLKIARTCRPGSTQTPPPRPPGAGSDLPAVRHTIGTASNATPLVLGCRAG